MSYGRKAKVIRDGIAALVSIYAVCIVTGCGGATSTAGQLFTAPPAPGTPTTTNPTVKASLVYACNLEDSAIDVYTANLSGDVTPASTLPAQSACGVAGDSDGNIYVASATFNASVVNVYAAGSKTSSRSITLPNAGMISQMVAMPPVQAADQVTTMATDSSGKLYVAVNSQRIYVYAPGASGAATPLHTISGSATTLASNGANKVNQMVVDREGDLFVAEGNSVSGGRLVMFAPDADGNVAPTPVLGAGYAPTGVALDAAEDLYVCQESTTTLAPTDPAYLPDAIYEFAKGSVPGTAPLRIITGSATEVVNCGDVQVDGAGNIFAMTYDHGYGMVLVFGTSASGNVAPSSTMNLNNKEQGNIATQFYLQ